MWSLRKVTASDAIFKNAKSIRKQVFVEEQGVPENLEYDEYEAHSSHFLVLIRKKQWQRPGGVEQNMGLSLSALLFYHTIEGKGLVNFLFYKMIQEVKSLSDCVYLNAQIQVVSFYEQLHFERVGPIFEEAGIQHYKMVLKDT